MAALAHVDNPYVAMWSVLEEPLVAALAKPKPVGTIQMCKRGVCGAPISLTGQRDTVTPTFTALFPHVQLDDGIQMRLSLTDKRLLGNEPIGTIDVNTRDLLAALNQGAGHVYDVRVDDQGTHQILFVGVSVVREQQSP